MRLATQKQPRLGLSRKGKHRIYQRKYELEQGLIAEFLDIYRPFIDRSKNEKEQAVVRMPEEYDFSLPKDFAEQLAE